MVNEIAFKAIDILQALSGKLGTTVLLGALSDDKMSGTVLAASKRMEGFSFHVATGYRFPLHASAPGKVLLAYLPPHEQESLLAQLDLKRYTPSTITGIEDFKAELKHAVTKGYAIDVSEQIEGCHCAGVPVFNEAKEVVAAIWATGPSSQLPVRNLNPIATTLKQGSMDLSQRLLNTRHSPGRDYITSVVQQAKTYIDNHLYTAIDIQELAKNLYVGYSWFRKIFKEQTGEAPSTYHLNRRIDQSIVLLETSGLSIREISEELGFKNQNHFSALFKRKTGLSPSLYRHNSGDAAQSC
jgi:DNA-binding IclR family transcriptional regulator/AraC-like DNA-binding protein